MGFFKNINEKMKASNEKFMEEERIRKENEPGKNGIRGKYLAYWEKPFSSAFKYLAEGTNPFNFICSHCLKTILIENIPALKCPYCNTENTGAGSIFFGCGKCDGIIKYFECPHCQKDIDLFADYNEEELKRRRYE